MQRSSGTSYSRLFLLIAPFLYAAYALITPPLQSPDEHQHLFRAWQLSEGAIVGERRGERSGGVLPGALSLAAEKEIGTADLHILNRPMAQRIPGELHHTTLGAAPVRFTNFYGSAIYSPLGYIPQVAGVLVGRMAGASVEKTILLGRLFNAALAVSLIALALRITPWGGSVILWTGLLPMTAALSASLGQDGLVIAGTCLLLAVAFRTIREASESLVPLHVALAAVVALSKLIYLPLALIGARLGAPRKGGFRIINASLLPFVLALLVVATWQWIVSPLQIPPKQGLPAIGPRLGMVADDLTLFSEPLWATLQLQAGFYLRSNFTFGWLMVGPDLLSMRITILALIAVLLAGDPAGAAPSPGRRAWLILLAMGTASLIFVAMFFLYTLPGDTVIDGIQGRYFIPAATVLLAAILPRKALAPRANLLFPWLMLAANLSALATIAMTFYRF
jgi:uncharacterized membrane protein